MLYVAPVMATYINTQPSENESKTGQEIQENSKNRDIGSLDRISRCCKHKDSLSSLLVLGSLCIGQNKTQSALSTPYILVFSSVYFFLIFLNHFMKDTHKVFDIACNVFVLFPHLIYQKHTVRKIPNDFKPVFHLAILFARTDKKVGTVRNSSYLFAANFFASQF